MFQIRWLKALKSTNTVVSSDHHRSLIMGSDIVYHVINRANARMQIFDEDKDYMLFEKVLEEAKEKFDMRILSYCIMPNHWHLALYPKTDGSLQLFMRWLSMTQTGRWHSQHKSIGSGHLYQERYKSFLLQAINRS